MTVVRRREPQKRMSLSLSSDLVEWVRAAAHDADVPVSRLVAEAIRRLRDPDWRDQDRVETCQDCGHRVGLVWTAPDVLWTAVTGRSDGGGVFCPVCFDRRAFAQGRFIRWVPQQEEPGQPGH